MTDMWRSEVNLQELVLLSTTWVPKLIFGPSGSKHLCPVSYLPQFLNKTIRAMILEKENLRIKGKRWM